MKKRKIIVCTCFILLVAAAIAVIGRYGGGDITLASLRPDKVKSMSIRVSDPTRYLELSESDMSQVVELLSQVKIGTEEYPGFVGSPVPIHFLLTLKNGRQYDLSLSYESIRFEPYHEQKREDKSRYETSADTPSTPSIRIYPSEDHVVRELCDLVYEISEKYMAINNPNYEKLKEYCEKMRDMQAGG